MFEMAGKAEEYDRGMRWLQKAINAVPQSADYMLPIPGRSSHSLELLWLEINDNWAGKAAWVDFHASSGTCISNGGHCVPEVAIVKAREALRRAHVNETVLLDHFG